MKKLLSILALALCFVACQNEPEVNVSNSDLVDVVLNIEAPELGITRAGQDGQDDSKNAKDSAYGAIDYADAAFWAQNDLRYILEVYAENDSDGSEGPIAKERLVNCLDAYAPTEFKLRLVPNRTYKFVVFADFVAEGSRQLSNPLEIADVYYNTKDLTDITSLTGGAQWNAMNEARDAYFITENIHVTTGLTQSLILTRPFAKVRVVTTDILDLEKYATPAKVVVTYYNHPIFKSFNAVNGAISTEMTGDELTHVVTYNDQYDAGYDGANYPSHMTLYADYIHAIADQQSNINFRMDVFDQSGRLLKSNDFSTEIPVQRNHLTTLMGNVLTTEAKVQILISDEFAGYYEYEVPEGVFDNDTIIVTGFENGGTYANGAYSYNVSNATTGDSFTLNIKDSALTNGTLAEGEYEFGTDFTATDVMVNVTRAAAAATAEGGKMVVDIDENNKYAIAIDLVVKDAANNVIYPSFGFYGDFAIKAVETLAAPANFVGAVDGEKVTFTWTAVEKATSYEVVFNGITATISEGTTATFTVQATDEEQKLTASIVAKADGYINSDAATCEVVIPAKVVEPAEPVILYLQPNANWNKDNARFAAYFFNNDGNTSWADMTLVEGETNIYTVTVPAGFDNIIFCRMNPTATANDWNNKWNQTSDLKVPTDGTNLYTVTEGAWDNGEGTWSIFTATTPVVPVAIATPNVTVSVNVNVVTLTWDAVEGAAHYTVQVDDDVEEVVNTTSYTFEGDYEVKYTFTVKAIAADTEKNLDSEAAVVTATTEAKPADVPAAGSELTVEEFLTLANLENEYVLTGKITRVVNTVYGNFDLTDETGTIYIYGLVTPEGAEKTQWAAAGLREGDTITIKGKYSLYNGDPQISKAKYVSHVSAPFIQAAPVTIEAATTNATIAVASNVAWSVTCDAAWVTSYTQSGLNNGTIEVVMVANETEESRFATFTLSGEGVADVTIKLTQKGKPAEGEIAGGSDDFHTITSTNTSYVSGKTTAGWSYTNCAIFKGGTSDASPKFKMIGDESNRALCMNGKTSAVGTITSPTLTTGCGTLKFNYGLPFKDTKIKFRVDIKQNGTVVKTFTVDKTSATQYTGYSYEEEINVTGDFQIVFTNLSPSNSTSNADRTAIWDVEWTGYNE